MEKEIDMILGLYSGYFRDPCVNSLLTTCQLKGLVPRCSVRSKAVAGGA